MVKVRGQLKSSVKVTENSSGIYSISHKHILFSSSDGKRRGEARETFLINPGPSKGACEVGPTTGVEYVTEFKVFCREWQDKVGFQWNTCNKYGG